jgi:hypothetical protein
MNAVSLLDKWQMMQAILADRALSATAKNVAARLLHHLNTKNSRCSPSYETLARGIGLVRRRAMAGVQELEKAGWISVERTTHEKSKGAERGLPSNNFAFDWDRCKEADPSAENDTTLVHDSTLASAEDDTSPSAVSDTPLVPNSALALVPDSAPKQGNIKPGIETGNKSVLRAALRTGFDEWLSHYPRKASRGRAETAYRRIIESREATHEELVSGAIRYSTERAGENPKFTLYPATWLNGKSWLDEPTAPVPHQSRNPRDRLSAAQEMALAGGWGGTSHE